MDRFWNKVRKTRGCWYWEAATVSKDPQVAYGVFWYQRRNHRAHRMSWTLTNGEIPEGMHVLHKCDNPRCVKPDHLFIGNRSDNMQDSANKGRNGMQRYPEKSHWTKLTTVKVREIRKLIKRKVMQKKIASRFGVHPDTIRRIGNRELWGWLP